MTLAQAKKESALLSEYIRKNKDKIGAQNSQHKPEWERLQYLRTFILKEMQKSRLKE